MKITLASRVVFCLQKAGRPLTTDQIVAECGKYVDATQALRAWERYKRYDTARRKRKTNRGPEGGVKPDKVKTGTRITLQNALDNLVKRDTVDRVRAGVYQFPVKRLAVG